MGKNLFESMYLPLPSPVQQMKKRGNLEEAEAYLQHLIETGECLPEERRRFRAEQEILRRLPVEYPYTRVETLELVRRYVPNFSEADFDSLLTDGRIFWRYLDGEPRYFGRFFDSLCKTDFFFAEAAAKQGHCIPGSDRRLLEESAEKMRAQGELSVRITVRAELELEEAFFREGALVRAYLPLPRVTEEQSDIVLEEMSAGGPIGRAAQRGKRGAARCLLGGKIRGKPSFYCKLSLSAYRALPRCLRTCGANASRGQSREAVRKWDNKVRCRKANRERI